MYLMSSMKRNYLSVYQIALILIYEVAANKQNIAVIGGGIGGTTTAYEFTNLALKHGVDFHMDLYEAREVGGRLATASIGGMEFETGGSIIHESNKYMNTYMEKFKFAKNTHSEDKDSSFGFYNGKEFVFVSSHYQILTLLKLWWRYGLNLPLFEDILDPIIHSFERIYDMQSREETFSNIHNFLSSLSPDFLSFLNKTTKDWLLESKIPELFVNEFVFIATNVNYNQATDIHAFVGAVALAGGVDENKLWSVRGGNKQIPEALLAHSDARFVNKAVEAIVLLPNSKYALQVDNNTHVYDYVVLASPIFDESKNKIKFEGFPSDISPPFEYKRTVATLVHGVLNYTYFSFATYAHCPHNIFSVNKDLFFNSISVLNPVTPNKDYDGKVFKIFSKDILTDEQLDTLFLTRDSVSVNDWFAYPIYDTVNRNISFKLHDNLFYVNAIEWAASCMEMSALSGVNAAFQVFKQMQEQASHKN